MSRPLVRKGGIIVFLDLTDHGGMPNECVDVPRLWLILRRISAIRPIEVALPGASLAAGGSREKMNIGYVV